MPGDAVSEDLAPLVGYLQDAVGLRFDGARASHLLAVLRASMDEAPVEGAKEYVAHLRADREAFDALVERLTVAETYFFRHPEQLAVLAERILPQIAARRLPGAPLRLWSAGCASGEEPYSLAMILEDVGVEDATILATDVSPAQLRCAKTATYRRWSLRGATGQLHRFERVGDRYRVPDHVSARVELRLLNLLADAYPTGVDVILCRNVLLYFSDEQVRRVAGRMAQVLSPGGWLITAPTDPDLDFQGALEPVPTSGGMVYHRPAETGSGATEPRPSRRPPPAPARHRLRAAAARRPAAPPAERPPSAHPVEALQAMEAGDYAAAAAAAQSAVRNGGDLPAMRAVWARALGNSGSVDDARRVAAEAVEVFPTEPELRYLHAELLLEAGHAHAAVIEASAAVYLDPDLAVAHLVLGRAHMKRGHSELARRSFRTAATLLDAVSVQVEDDSLSDMSRYAAAYLRLAETTGGEE